MTVNKEESVYDQMQSAIDQREQLRKELLQSHETISRQVQQLRTLSADNKALRGCGLSLVAAATHVATEYDGVHRLMIEASRFLDTVANEGGRGERFGPGAGGWPHSPHNMPDDPNPPNFGPDETEQLRQLIADQPKPETVKLRLQYRLDGTMSNNHAVTWKDCILASGTIEIVARPECFSQIQRVTNQNHRWSKVEDDAGL